MSKLGKTLSKAAQGGKALIKNSKNTMAFNAVAGISAGVGVALWDDMPTFVAFLVGYAACRIATAEGIKEDKKSQEYKNNSIYKQYSDDDLNRAMQGVLGVAIMVGAVLFANKATKTLMDKETDKEPETKTVTMTQADLAPAGNDLKTYQYKPC